MNKLDELEALHAKITSNEATLEEWSDLVDEFPALIRCVRAAEAYWECINYPNGKSKAWDLDPRVENKTWDLGCELGAAIAALKEE